LKIAVYTIALNEAAHAERWANSAVEADYRVVADTGSADDTVERLAKSGVTVHRIAVRPWRFDVARNTAMALIPADVDVCLSMDMDEYLAPKWRPKIESAWTPETTAVWCRKVVGASVDSSRSFSVKNFHHRWGYRFKRPVHEMLVFSGQKEVVRDCSDIVLHHVQDHSKTTRSQYLPLMELALAEDPQDAQICFWLGRDYMWANQNERGAELLERYLALPSSTWADERSEAMRYLARMQPNKKMTWLDKARVEAPYRREIWLDLAEELHSKSDWVNLFWACSNGIQNTRRTGSYLDDPYCWGFRLFDLGAIASWHLNVMDRAVEWGEKALELAPADERLKSNVSFFVRLRTSMHSETRRMTLAPVSDTEEAWFAKLQDARCLRALCDEDGFVRAAQAAIRMRPHRAEPLHDLARYYLGKSRGDIAMEYAEAGLALTLPEPDTLGVEKEVYETGLKEVFTIAASYSEDPLVKERGRRICNWLSLKRDVPESVRGLARYNSRWYVEPVKSLTPSIVFHSLTVPTPEGYTPGNVSIVRTSAGFVALVRAVNYDLLPNGYFDRRGDTSFRQRIIALHLDEQLRVLGSVEVLSPKDMPLPKHLDSLGFEDPRPFTWRGDLWSVSSVRQLNDEGRAEMVLARVDRKSADQYVFADWRVLASGMPVRWEKNWMPQVVGADLRFIYSTDPTRIISDSGVTLFSESAPIAADNFRGGSQAIPFDGGWLMLIHEWELIGERRNYFHRFLWLDANGRVARLSLRFFFIRIASEFATGLAWYSTGEHLVISFGIDDHEPTLAIVHANDVNATLLSVERHRRASAEACENGHQGQGGKLSSA